MADIINLEERRLARLPNLPSIAYVAMLEAEVRAEAALGEISPVLRSECERVLRLCGRIT